MKAQSQDYKNWVRQAPRLSESYFLSDSSFAVADRVVASQLPNGGWPKNINFFHESLQDATDLNLATIDNSATFTEVRFLLRLCEVRRQSNVDVSNNQVLQRYQQAAIRGILYLLTMQYPNGGFPQYYPRDDHYHAYTTYNDNAMVNALELLRQVAQYESPFQHLGYDFSTTPDSLRYACAQAFQRGVDCILRSQIVIDGQRTLWCQQHDPQTLEPRPARAYEHASIVTAESIGVLQLLMSLPHPSEDVKRSIEGGMKWLQAHAIVGYEREHFTDSLGRTDYRLRPCPMDDYPCPRFWARFYDLQSQQPIFSGRDSIIHYRVEDIEYERRNGYSWFVDQPERLFPLYREWKKLHQ